MADNGDIVDLNESISEVSILEDGELFVSTVHLEHDETAEPGCRDSRVLDSQATLSQTSFTDESVSSFKKLPELARYFKKRRLDSGKVDITCQACSKALNTRGMKRFTSHASKKESKKSHFVVN